MLPQTTRQIHLASRPEGLPVAANFSLVETRLPLLKDGEVLVRNLWMSVDPYMRGRMADRPSYVPPFRVGEVLDGGAVGEVLASEAPAFAVGDCVSSAFGWREHFVAAAAQLQKIDPLLGPLPSFLGVLGMPGMTAWTGLTRIGQVQAGETVFVSAASGAVGGTAVQIARELGARVVASVGSSEKAEWLHGLGIESVIDYRRSENLAADLQRAAPDGIDVYFDNVGGAHLEAALANLKRYGRIVACGMIAQYNDREAPPGPRNLAQIVMRSLRMQGFIVTDHWTHYPEFVAQMGQWLQQDRIKVRETVREGLEAAPEAFIDLFRGDNLGKMLVRLA